ANSVRQDWPTATARARNVRNGCTASRDGHYRMRRRRRRRQRHAGRHAGRHVNNYRDGYVRRAGAYNHRDVDGAVGRQRLTLSYKLNLAAGMNLQFIPMGAEVKASAGRAPERSKRIGCAEHLVDQTAFGIFSSSVRKTALLLSEKPSPTHFRQTRRQTPKPRALPARAPRVPVRSFLEFGFRAIVQRLVGTAPPILRMRRDRLAPMHRQPPE